MNTRNAIGVFLIGTGLFCASAKATICPPCPPCHLSVEYPECCWYRCKESKCESCVNGSCVECGGISNLKCCGPAGARFCCSQTNCWRCEDGECKYTCDPNNCEECVNNQCLECGGRPDEECCESMICYNTTTQKCCPGGGGRLCGSDQECCGTSECCNNETEKCCPNGACATKCNVEDGENCSSLQTITCSGCAFFDWENCHVHGPATQKEYEGGVEKICSPRGCEGDCIEDQKLCNTEYPCIKPDGYILFRECSGATSPECMDMFPFPYRCYPCVKDTKNKDEHFVQNDSCK